MSDEMDRAQEINEQFQTAVLDAHHRNRPHGPAAIYCEDCGEQIPEARRRAAPGCKRCIDCQSDLEKILNHWRPL